MNWSSGMATPLTITMSEPIQKDSRIYVAGHTGLVGSAIVRQLHKRGYSNFILRTHKELDLTDQKAVQEFFIKEKPEYVFLAAAKVGGIHANNTYPAEFIYINLAIQNNIIHQSYLNGVKRLLFLGSSCIYPRDCPQPIKEEYLLTGPLEPTNRPYALAKIAGIEMCWSYNRQYGTQYLAAMPTNLFGPGDNYHGENSHVVPALIRRFHEAKINKSPTVTIWGTGTPRRELMYSDDMADICIDLLNLPNEDYKPLLASDRNKGLPPVINIGVGEDLTIAELAKKIRMIIDYKGEIIYDTNKPDGTLQKLLDISRIKNLGLSLNASLNNYLKLTYADFVNNIE